MSAPSSDENRLTRPHRPARPGRLRLAHAESVPRQPGPAAGRRGGVLRAALDRAVADPDRDRAVARDRPGRAARHAGPLPRMADARPVARDRARAGQLSRSPRADRLGARHHDAVLQLARVHGAGERDVGDLPAPRGRAQTPLPCLGVAALPLHPVARRRHVAGHAGGGQPDGDRSGTGRAARPQLVVARCFRRVALLARLRGRGVRVDLGLPRDALRAPPHHARADRRRDSGRVVGDHAPRARVVLRDAVAGQRGLRLADDRDRRAAQPGDRGDAFAARRAGDLGIRAARA